jgi:Reverse transcriptase (RNA-dependent DNA polymerase)
VDSNAPRRNPPRSREGPKHLTDNYYALHAKSVEEEEPTYYYALHTKSVEKEEPATYASAVGGEDGDLWQAAMNEEMAALLENEAWVLEDLPPGAKAIPMKWVYKIKRDEKGNIERYKARVVAKGYEQREGVDFDEIYAPVSKHTTLRTLLAVVAAQGLELHQLDVKTAFLNGELEDEIFMQQPQGYHEGGKGKVCRLRRAIYGLKQAPRAWYLKLQEVLHEQGFKVSSADPGLYILECDGRKVYLLVYVDDILVAGKKGDIETVKAKIQGEFKVRDMGEAKYFLGMHIERCREDHAIKLSQKTFAEQLVYAAGLQDAKCKKVPMHPNTELRREGSPALDTEKFKYSELVGGLLYLSVCTRPDIAYAVGALARFMAHPLVAHWEAAKDVVRYIKGTSAMGVTFKGQGNTLVGYCDADYAGCVDTRKSTSGYVYLLNGGAVSWSSRMQPTVAVSTCEAEYMASAACVKEGLWFRKLMMDFSLSCPFVDLKCDNQGALKLLKHPIASARSKHIDVLHHFARDRVQRGEVVFTYCASEEMVADCFTKPVVEGKLAFCCLHMGVT